MNDSEIRAAYREHKDAVYRFAWRMTGSKATAEDIVQDCFTVLLRRPDAYDPARAPLRPFLLAMARNLAWKRWRTEQRWDALEDDACAVEPIDPSSGQISDLVGRAVQSLPPLQREALVLFEYDGLSLEEIARTVEAEVGTVKARLHRARENLRRMLKGVRYGTVER
ncbi:MAG: RNA polymerase sigma factor [Bryobacteraceae bacterium]